MTISHIDVMLTGLILTTMLEVDGPTSLQKPSLTHLEQSHYGMTMELWMVFWYGICLINLAFDIQCCTSHLHMDFRGQTSMNFYHLICSIKLSREPLKTT